MNGLIVQLISFGQEHWQDTKDFFNSSFSTAMAGAFAGAWGAQYIAERSKYRDELIKEIRNINAASVVAFGICNSLLSLKKQHVKALKENFYSQKKLLTDHRGKVQARAIDPKTAFEFQADLQTLTAPQFPIDILREQIFERLSLVGRPLNLTTTLSETLHCLNWSIERRNQLIESYKSATNPQVDLPVLYFGLPVNGHVDQTYPDVIDSVYSQTNDGIFFSNLLCKDLIEHGEKMAGVFSKKFGKGAPTINTTDFTKAEDAGLMPDEADYADWLTMFVKRIETPTFWQKIRLGLKSFINKAKLGSSTES
jgi:hypothetical protein